MPLQVPCPACQSSVIVQNARYLVFLNCHACGHEFMADDGILSLARAVPEPPVDSDASFHNVAFGDDSPPSEPGESILTFCPMCGELAPESTPTCTACGEALPVDRRWRRRDWNESSQAARRFRRHARWLGILWILLAYDLSSQDYWVGGVDLELPPMILSGQLAIPEIPLLTTILVALGAFAIVGQFWAVALGGLLNYLILFIVVWRAELLSLIVLAVSIVLTHIVLHQAASARSR